MCRYVLMAAAEKKRKKKKRKTKKNKEQAMERSIDWLDTLYIYVHISAALCGE